MDPAVFHWVLTPHHLEEISFEISFEKRSICQFKCQREGSPDFQAVVKFVTFTFIQSLYYRTASPHAFATTFALARAWSILLFS